MNTSKHMCAIPVTSILSIPILYFGKNVYTYLWLTSLIFLIIECTSVHSIPIS